MEKECMHLLVEESSNATASTAASTASTNTTGTTTNTTNTTTSNTTSATTMGQVCCGDGDGDGDCKPVVGVAKRSLLSTDNSTINFLTTSHGTTRTANGHHVQFTQEEEEEEHPSQSVAEPVPANGPAETLSETAAVETAAAPSDTAGHYSTSASTPASTGPQTTSAPTASVTTFASMATVTATPPLPPKSIQSISPFTALPIPSLEPPSPSAGFPTMVPKPSPAAREDSIFLSLDSSGRSSLIMPPPSGPSGHHRRISSNDGSYPILSLEAVDQLHASWTSGGTFGGTIGAGSGGGGSSFNRQKNDLSFGSSAGFAPTVGESGRPKPLSRLSSTASTMSAASGHGVPHRGSSFLSDTTDYNGNGVSSVIHDAARITNWESVKKLCEEDPDAATYIGRDRWTALHHACNRRCPDPDVVEALIRAYPDALTLEEDKGWCPLHYACRFKAPRAVVALLVRMVPEKGRPAVTKLDRQGRTPLYYAVRYDAPPGVVGILLDVDASVVLEEDQTGDSPLGLVWESWAEKLDGKRTLQKIFLPADNATDMSLDNRVAHVQKRLLSQSKVLNRWNTVDLFLRAAFGFPVDDDEDGNDATRTGKENQLENPADESNKDASSGGVSAQTKDRTWRLLHAAAAIKCHPSLFQLAYALHPEQAMEFDELDLEGPSNVAGGWQSASHLSALHLAASSQANGDSGRAVLHQLLSLKPNVVKIPDKNGSLPLHHIVENKFKTHWTRDGAKDVYLTYTRAVQIPDAEGRMPLHRAAAAIVPQGDASNETTNARSVICNLLELHPDASSHSDIFGRLPLHFAVKHGTSWDIQLQSLYDAYPGAVRARTGVKLGNKLPLHIAASNRDAESSLISHLVRFHPRGASQAHRGGKLPLHLSCETGLSWESVKVIHEANPDGVVQVEHNSRGWKALQMAAASYKADDELLSNLVQLHPEAANDVDSRGRFALHLACISGKTWTGGLSTLFDANPDAVRCADSLGLLPFHIACFRYCAADGKEVETPLASTEPPGLNTPSNHHRRNSSRVSMEAILREQAKEAKSAQRVDIIFHLLRSDPTVLL